MIKSGREIKQLIHTVVHVKWANIKLFKLIGDSAYISPNGFRSGISTLTSTFIPKRKIELQNKKGLTKIKFKKTKFTSETRNKKRMRRKLLLSPIKYESVCAQFQFDSKTAKYYWAGRKFKLCRPKTLIDESSTRIWSQPTPGLQKYITKNITHIILYFFLLF